MLPRDPPHSRRLDAGLPADISFSAQPTVATEHRFNARNPKICATHPAAVAVRTENHQASIDLRLSPTHFLASRPSRPTSLGTISQRDATLEILCFERRKPQPKGRRQHKMLRWIIGACEIRILLKHYAFSGLLCRDQGKPARTAQRARGPGCNPTTRLTGQQLLLTLQNS